MSSNRVGNETKRRLCEALKKKMAKKPLEKITVKEIVEDCGMNRQTFYYHFDDIYDQVRWMYERELFDPLKKRATAETWQDMMLELLQYVEKNKSVTRSAIISFSREQLRSFFYENVRDISVKIITSFKNEIENDAAYELPKEYEEMIVYYIMVSFVGLADSWARGELNKKPEEIVAFAETIVNDLLCGAVIRLRGLN